MITLIDAKTGLPVDEFVEKSASFVERRHKRRIFVREDDYRDLEIYCLDKDELESLLAMKERSIHNEERIEQLTRRVRKFEKKHNIQYSFNWNKF